MNMPVDPSRPAAATTDGRDARTRLLLEAPVLPTLLRLAAPNMGEAAARVTFIACDALFVSWLGTDALAAIAIVFPLFLVTQMISAGGLGAGVAAAVARAIGEGDMVRASRMAGQGLLLALVCAAVIAAGMFAFGAPLFSLMGAEGAVLELALIYAGLVFGGGFAVWLMNIAANVLRGTGNMAVPAAAIVIGEAGHLLLSPALILGWGPLPQLGIAGAGIGVLAAYGIGSVILLGYLAAGRSLVRPGWRDLMPDPAGMKPVLRVGLFSGLNVLQFQFTTLVMTAFVGGYGAATLAGFGAALRLELLQIPIVFAFGSAVIAMTATNAGAGDMQRVRRIVWSGAVVAAGIGAVFGAIALLLPGVWMRLLTDDPQVIAAGQEYLTVVGGTLPMLGLALGLFFAALGVGQVAAPFLLGLARLGLIAAGGGAALAFWQAEASTLYLIVAAAYVLYGLAMLWCVRRLLNRL